MDHNASSDMLDPSTLAAEIHIAETTLGQWRYLKKGPAYHKIGRHVRYRRSDVDSWLAEQFVETAR